MLKLGDINIYFEHLKDETGSFISGEGSRSTLDFRGVTNCYIERGDEVISEGSAFCSVNDRFDKSVGRKISLTRALQDFDKEFRTSVWKLYREAIKR